MSEENKDAPLPTPTPPQGQPVKKGEDIAPTPTPSTGSPLREDNGDSNNE